jgi:hypothetical protein
MSKEILEENLVGIDTPNESKQAGNTAGAYGRGFYVIAMCGTGKTYVESRQGTQHNALTIKPEGKYSPARTPSSTRSQLPSGTQGTYIHVTDVRETDLEMLSDWKEVEKVLVEKFTFLLLRDDVEVKYVIDGEVHTPSPPDLQKYQNSDELLHVDKLPKFPAEGNEYQIHDLVVVRTENMEEAPPWRGVAMLKGDIDGDPFMTVKAYQPQRIPSLRNPAKMVGWCDARELCPELENNSHTSFRGYESDTGIKGELQRLHDEHFKKGRTTKETEALSGNITEELNELLADVDDFSDYLRYGSGVMIEQGGEDEDEDGPETKEDDNDEPDIIRCQAGNRQFNPGDEITLKVTVNNPKDPESTKYELYDIRIDCTEHDLQRGFAPKQIEVIENQSEIFNIERIRPEKEGVYVFSAAIRTRPEVVELGEGDNNDTEELDRSRIFIRVGDPEKEDGSTAKEKESGGQGGEDNTHAEIVHDVTFFPDEEATWKALASEDDEGFEVTINTDRPEWQRALAIVDNDDLRDEIQLKFGVEWGSEELILQRNIDVISELLGETTIEGERVADITAEELRKRADILADLEAKIEERHNSEYRS